jgi:hypothetical protein
MIYMPVGYILSFMGFLSFLVHLSWIVFLLFFICVNIYLDGLLEGLFVILSVTVKHTSPTSSKLLLGLLYTFVSRPETYQLGAQENETNIY